jgi:hypothetical protein
LLESHLLAFAAEKARVEGTIVDMGAYRQQVESGPNPTSYAHPPS